MKQQDGEPLSGLPERYLCKDDRFAFTDDDGFLKTSESIGLVALSELLRHWCSLVLAPPWMGKTHISKALAKALQTGTLGEPTSISSGRVYRTCFETLRQHESFLPPWWDPWRRSDETACWIIDAVDEGQAREPGTSDRLAEVLADLDDRQRGRLRVPMFSRQRGLPAGLPARLAALSVHSVGLEPTQFAQYQFGPLTREEAARIVGGQEPLDRAVQIIRQHDLQDEARFPKVLERLSKLPVNAEVTTESIWRDLLMDLLVEANPNRRQPPTSQPEDRFKAASHIAAVLTLTGKEEFSCGVHHSSGLSLNEIVPHSIEPDAPSRQAAYEALDTDLFHWTATGYRFAQKNIQEKLCAFGLSHLKLNSLTPMMVDSQGHPSATHVEMLNFLGAISKHGDVRKWVAENVGLLESDAPRLSFSLAKQALARLFDVVRNTPHYLYDVDLRRLAAPRIGTELRRRLRQRARMKPNVLRLLLDISAETGAKEIVPAACRIALDDGEPIPVRRSALRVVQWCGATDDVRKLEALATNAGSDEEQRNLAAAVARSLLERGIWDVTKAALFAPPETPHTIDSCSMLISEIKEKATPGDARNVIRQFLEAQEGVVLRPVVDPLSLDEPKKELLSAMVNVLLQQDRLSTPDIDVLAWAAVSVPFFDLPNGLGGSLVRKVSEQPDVRREVFMLGLREWQTNVTQNQRPRGHWAWQDVLQYDDIDWLAERAQGLQDCPEFVWTHLLGLAYYRSEGKPDAMAWKRRVGALVCQQVPESFRRFMASRREYARQQQQSQQRQQRRQEEHPRFGIDDIVADTVAQEELELQQKLWKLSWICFVEPSFRPSNVDGEWPALKDNLKQATLDVCLRGLTDCSPTPIPDGSAFSQAVIFEASAFVALLKYREPREWLTPDLIEKWLPSVFRALGNEESWACGKCARVSAPAVQKAALHWLDRDLRQENPPAYAGADIPAELWDSNFADEIVKRIRNPECSVEPRTGLLRWLAERNPQQALPVAKEWMSTGSWIDQKHRPLLQVALDVLLALAPEEGWPMVQRLYESHGPPVILGLDSICEGHEQGKFDRWPSIALAELGIILYKEFPRTPDEHKSGRVSRADRARWARDAVPNVLFSRGDAAGDALRKLADAVPVVKTWLDYHQARRAASQVLDATQERPVFPLSEVLRVLTEANYRLIRTDSDLFKVLVETLTERIATDSGEDVEMLYDGQHKHLRENALQAYLACRLRDLLPGKVLHRETQITRRKRTDILVEAPALAGPITAVVIEVKWSNNRTTKDSLTKQLGKEYLLNEGKKYGIYLVGWCGRTSWGALEDKTSDGLRRALERQAKVFCTRHGGTSIQVVVVDLQWSNRGQRTLRAGTDA